MPKVYIINDSGHDYSAAREYGELVYLTKGLVKPYATTQHFRVFAEQMRDATKEDYILITGLASMNALAGWIIGTLNLPLKLLIHQPKNNTYVVRNIVDRLLHREIGE